MYIVITAIHNDIALNHMLIRLNWPVYKVTFVLSKGQLVVIRYFCQKIDPYAIS